VSAAASGGSCRSGALSGAAGAAATPLANQVFQHPSENLGDYVGGTAATGVVGGLASVAGGGKFENGAVTAAFGYMFNNCFSCLKQRESDPRLSGRADDTLSPLDFLNPRGWSRALAGIGAEVAGAEVAAGSRALVPTLGDHALEGMTKYGITQDMVTTAIESGRPFYDPANNSLVYVLEGAWPVVEVCLSRRT